MSKDVSTEQESNPRPHVREPRALPINHTNTVLLTVVIRISYKKAEYNNVDGERGILQVR